MERAANLDNLTNLPERVHGNTPESMRDVGLPHQGDVVAVLGSNGTKGAPQVLEVIVAYFNIGLVHKRIERVWPEGLVGN